MRTMSVDMLTSNEEADQRQSVKSLVSNFVRESMKTQIGTSSSRTPQGPEGPIKTLKHVYACSMSSTRPLLGRIHCSRSTTIRAPDEKGFTMTTIQMNKGRLTAVARLIRRFLEAVRRPHSR